MTRANFQPSLSLPCPPALFLQAGERVTHTNFRLGLRVERGTDWKWDAQDGGPGGAGITINDDQDGWAKVRARL